MAEARNHHVLPSAKSHLHDFQDLVDNLSDFPFQETAVINQLLSQIGRGHGHQPPSYIFTGLNKRD
jgi:hypothetical protein